MATHAQIYQATDEDFPAFFGVPAPRAPALPLDLTPKQYPREFCTLKNQSERWLWTLENKRTKPAPSTLVNYRSSLKRVFEIMPELSETKLEQVDSETLRVFVNKASAPYSTNASFPRFGLKPDEKESVPTKILSAISIRQLLVIVKLVVASAKDHRGNKFFSLKDFDSEHIDAPPVGEQHRPCLKAEEIERMIGLAETEQERLLYIVLAATGLRISELQAVSIGPENEKRSTWDKETASIFVRSQCYRDREIFRLKTKAAKRTVHLHSSVNELIAQFAEGRENGYLFQGVSRQPARAAVVRFNMSKRLTGAAPHAFRRSRVTFLRTVVRLQEDILKLEIGHDAGANKDITNLYSRPSDETCRTAIEAAGIGFQIGGTSA